MKLLSLVLMLTLAQFSVASYAQEAPAAPAAPAATETPATPGPAGAPAGDWGANRHIARGLTCASCHGANNEIETPEMEQCVKCHNPEQVAEKTANVQPHNPHNSPHYQTNLDCTLCHLQHEAPVNYCAQCHEFDFHVK